MGKIRVDITTMAHQGKSQLVLLAVAPTGAILCRKFIGNSLSRMEIVQRTQEFTELWVGKVYRQLSVVVPCDPVLL